MKLKGESKSKKINIENAIMSIDTSDPEIINNLVNDYSVTIIDNRELYIAMDTVLNEISNYSLYPEFTYISEILNILDLNHEFLDKEVESLTTTEKIYLNILRNISKENKILLFKNVFLGLDRNNQKKIINLINFLKEKEYLVIIMSENIDVLYKLSGYSLIATKSMIKYGKTDDIYTDIKTLLNNKLNVPILPYITYKAKEEKNVKLFYSKDVRDIIKDIYKHV